MFQPFRRNGFELEKTYPGFFLLEGGTAGIVAGLLFEIFVLKTNSSEGSPLASGPGSIFNCLGASFQNWEAPLQQSK